MDWKQPFRFRNLRFRNTCIVILLLAVNLLILFIFTWSGKPDSEAAACAVCGGKQRWIYRIMSEVPDGNSFELPPEWTVADLIREAVRKDRRTSHPLPEEEFICRNIRYVRVHAFPYLRRQRVEVTSPYLVFPVPASAVFDESLQEPVPILMCPPGAHGDKRGSMVLYSDGSTNSLTIEEAEKLVEEYQPEPIKFQIDSGIEQDTQDAADRQD